MWRVVAGWRVLAWQRWNPEKGGPGPPPAPDITTADEPRLVTVTLWLDDVEPMWTGPKSRLVGLIRNCGLMPVPLSAMLKFWPFQEPDEVVLAGPALVGAKP